MIAINRLLIADFGWKKNFELRVEKALRESGRTDVVLYPDEPQVMQYGKEPLSASMHHLQSSIEWLYRHRNDVSRIIHLEAYQFPHVQQSYAGTLIPFEVVIHAGIELIRYPLYKAEAIMDYCQMLDHIILQTSITGFGYAAQTQRVIGGFLESFEANSDRKYPHRVVWAGNRAYDPAKGWERFLSIVQHHPEMTFILGMDRTPVEIFAYPNIECYEGCSTERFIDHCRDARYVLSTSETDSFSYGLFDAISVGCIPLVTDTLYHGEWIPEKFMFGGEPDFSLSASAEELAAIVAPHHYSKTFARLLGEDTF